MLKQRTGKECKKEKCKRYKEYLEWTPGNPNLQYCMNCKNAFVSQYERSISKK